jgi:ferritin heavy chain
MNRVAILLSLLVALVSVLVFPPLVTSYGDEDIANHDRYTLHPHCVESLQQQIDMELMASLTYLNMAAHFAHNSISRLGFAKFFEEQSAEEKSHAQKLIGYLNKRGAKVLRVDVTNPTKDTWATCQLATEDAIALEKQVNNKLHVVHKTAEHVCKDPHLMNFLEGVFLTEQVDSIHSLNRIRTLLLNFDRGNKALGEYFVDQLLLGKDDRKNNYFEL